MLVNLKELLADAYKRKYAVGAFNINDMEFLQSVVNAAEKLNSPAIIQTSQGAIKFAGVKLIKDMVYSLCEKSKVPFVLHLDHGRDEQIIMDCINNGWTSIMFDGSHLPFEENIRQTEKYAKLAHKKGLSIEAEIGTIGGAEEHVVSRNIIYTEPDQAKLFVDKTGVDALAVAIGTSHGAYKFLGPSKLDIGRLNVIDRLLKMPLVLHGASGVPKDVVKEANAFGAKLGEACGVSDDQISRSVKFGVCKVNEDTDLRLAWVASVRKTLAERPDEIDPRNVLGPARDFVQQIIERRMAVLGSVGKAK